MSRLPATLRPRFAGLIHEQAKGANYDAPAFLEYVGEVLSSSELPAPEKKAMLIDALSRIMPPNDSAQLSALLIILYNQERPASIDLEIASSGWLVCPFGPHILQPSAMKKHLNMNHFEKMKHYSYENGRLIPISQASPASSPSPSSAASPSSSSSSSSALSSFSQSDQYQSEHQSHRQQQSSQVTWQQGSGGTLASAGRGRGLVSHSASPQTLQHSGYAGHQPKPTSSPQPQPQPQPQSQSQAQYLQSLPPISFTETTDMDEAPVQTVEEISKYLPDIFTPDHFHGVSAPLFDICCTERYSAILVKNLQGDHFFLHFFFFPFFHSWEQV